MVVVTFSTQSSVLLSLRRKSSELTVFVHRVADPVDSRVITHSIVCRVDQDDLVVLVGRILVQELGKLISIPRIAKLWKRVREVV